jgi:hypothetical protein
VTNVNSHEHIIILSPVTDKIIEHKCPHIHGYGQFLGSFEYRDEEYFFTLIRYPASLGLPTIP